jgi:hypothetical protein
MPVAKDIYYVNDKGQLIRKVEDRYTRFIRKGLQENEEIVLFNNLKNVPSAKKAVEKWEKETGKKFSDKVRWLYAE